MSEFMRWARREQPVLLGLAVVGVAVAAYGAFKIVLMFVEALT